MKSIFSAIKVGVLSQVALIVVQAIDLLTCVTRGAHRSESLLTLMETFCLCLLNLSSLLNLIILACIVARKLFWSSFFIGIGLLGLLPSILSNYTPIFILKLLLWSTTLWALIALARQCKQAEPLPLGGQPRKTILKVVIGSLCGIGLAVIAVYALVFFMFWDPGDNPEQNPQGSFKSRRQWAEHLGSYTSCFKRVEQWVKSSEFIVGDVGDGIALAPLGKPNYIRPGFADGGSGAMNLEVRGSKGVGYLLLANAFYPSRSDCDYAIWTFNHQKTVLLGNGKADVSKQTLDIQRDMNEGDYVIMTITPPCDLNGKTRNEILAMRQREVDKYIALAPSQYAPSQAVFGQIQDGRPWWGLLGVDYYSDGLRSINGHAKESRFILNPYLLVGIEEACSHRVMRPLPASPEEFYHEPFTLMWERGGMWGQVTYSAMLYYRWAESFYYSDSKQFYLSDYNARDFGFNYLSVISDQSSNISGASDRIIPIVQFIHNGGHCGYPGGCNCKTPHDDALSFSWRILPARLYIKLWREHPASVSQKADMVFIINLN